MRVFRRTGAVLLFSMWFQPSKQPWECRDFLLRSSEAVIYRNKCIKDCHHMRSQPPALKEDCYSFGIETTLFSIERDMFYPQGHRSSSPDGARSTWLVTYTNAGWYSVYKFMLKEVLVIIFVTCRNDCRQAQKVLFRQKIIS